MEAMLLIAFLLSAFAQSVGSPGIGPQQVLDRVAGENLGYGGAVFRAAQGPDLLWQGASGSLTRNGAAMTSEAVFEIASTSKAMTAAAVLLEVEAGRLDLDAPLSNYLAPAFTDKLLVIGGHNYGPELTLRQLLSHTSGLPDYWYDPPFIVPGLTPLFVPGSGWHYSDSGYLLAGLVLEKVTGLPLQEIYRTRIYQPLGMHQTWLQWRENPPPGATQSHRYEGDWDMYTKGHNSADWAGGGLGSTTYDLHLFLRGIADGTLFANPATRDQMMAWTPTGDPGVHYGLGLYQVELPFGLGPIWGHDGYGNAWMYYWPNQDVTFTGTLNQTQNNLWPLLILAALAIEYR